MLFRRLGRVLDDVRRSAIVTGAVPLTDKQLVELFVVEGNQAGFEALVRRYGPMVFGVCRRVLRNTHDAEDAFQATFLVLVRKAARLRQREAVGNWLYGVAYRTALHARNRAMRRQVKEAAAEPLATEESSGQGAVRLELEAAVDQALSRLPEKYRIPVVLCDLQGKTQRQAAEELRCPEGTVSSRLARGRDLLRKGLGRHAPALAGGTGAVVLQTNTAAVLPASLVAATVRSAALVGKSTSVAAAGLAPHVAALLEGVLRSMLLAKMKYVAAVLMVMAVLGAAAGFIVNRLGAAHVLVVDRPGDAIVAKAGEIKAGQAEQQRKDQNQVGAEGAPVIAEAKADEQAKEPPGQKKQELLYGGKSFQDWRSVLLTDLKPETRMEAIAAIGAFGRNGYGDEATAAIFEVMKKYNAEEDIAGQMRVIGAAQSALDDIGEKALPALAKELESKNVNDRRMAATTLTRLTRNASDEARRILLRALNDDDGLVRQRALEAVALLKQNKRWTDELVASLSAKEKQELAVKLVDSVKDKNMAVRQYAAMVIGWLGPGGKAAVPALIELVGEKTQPKGAGSKKGISPLYSARRVAIDALGLIGPDAKEAVPALIVVVKSTDVVRQGPSTDSMLGLAAIEALGRIGPAANAAMPVLLDIMASDGQANFKDAAAAALERIGK
jgi:RNA polymerase sigma factor (sigma-70 family)